MTRRLALFAILLLPVAAAPSDLFRFSRPVSARPGWARLLLPDEVLDACRFRLPDLRLVREDGGEVPWALEERVGWSPVRFPLSDVERAVNRETTALLDRGPRPALAGSVALEIDGEDFLKPVTVESSDDGASWKAFAKGSVFATRLARSTALRFAPNDRRWWRFRFDDRNADPITPRAAVVRAADPAVELREVPLALTAREPGHGDSPFVTALLPATNLGVVALRIEGAGPAYVRRVRVAERIFFRDEVVRRPVGEGVLTRAPDGSGQDSIPLCEPSARALEIEVEETDGPPFVISRVVALARPRAILFSAPSGVGLRLLYGSALAEAPRYDVEKALSLARPLRFGPADLGPADTNRAQPAVFPLPPRGSPADPARWKWRQSIELPGSGNVAFLDLSASLLSEGGPPRILDSANRQVPYLFERAAHRERHPVASRVSTRETKTVVELTGLRDVETVDTVEITALAPAYFSRQAVVLEQLIDDRGAAGTRVLGAAAWEKRENEPSALLSIPIARPTSSRIRLEIENGDNAPILIGRTAVWTSVPRIDFVFSPGEKLTLVSGNPDTVAPRYDLELVAARVLASPAQAARLSGRTTTHVRPKRPAVLWVAVAAAAGLVALVLVRTLRAGV